MMTKSQIREDVKERAEQRKAKAGEEEGKVNPFSQWVQVYHDDPVAFARDMLNIDLHPYQQAPLMALARGDRKVAVRSGHGTGKTTDAAIAAIWFLLTRFPCRVVMTAPTLQQVQSVLFADIRSMISMLPIPLQSLVEVQRDRIFLIGAQDDSWMQARTARAEAPEALAGVHAENVLLMVDEASGVPDVVYEHAIGSMSGEKAHTLLLSNPTRRSGYFFKVFNDRAAGDGWSKFHFSCIDSPLVSDEFVDEVKATYGENSNAFRVRVLGEFPLQDTDAMFNGELVRDAMERDIEVDPTSPCTFGLDVARMGADRSALVVRRGNIIEDIKTWDKSTLMETTGVVVNYIREMDPETRPKEICVDAIGLGAGVADRLEEVCAQNSWDTRVISVNVAEVDTVDDRSHRLKDELLLKFRDWLETKAVAMPDQTDLYEDIVSIGYKFNSNGKIQAESKDELRRRGVKSTDLLDACALTFAGTGYMVHSGQRSNWSRALKRNIQGIV